METTQDQKEAILKRSREAQAFLASDLFKELEKWIKQEKELVAMTMATNSRSENEKNLTRAEFLERKSAYWLALLTIVAVFKGFASQEDQLKEIENAKKAH